MRCDEDESKPCQAHSTQTHTAPQTTAHTVSAAASISISRKINSEWRKLLIYFLIWKIYGNGSQCLKLNWLGAQNYRMYLLQDMRKNKKKYIPTFFSFYFDKKSEEHVSHQYDVCRYADYYDRRYATSRLSFLVPKYCCIQISARVHVTIVLSSWDVSGFVWSFFWVHIFINVEIRQIGASFIILCSPSRALRTQRINGNAAIVFHVKLQLSTVNATKLFFLKNGWLAIF